MIVFGALCFQDFNSFLVYFGFFVGTRSSKNFLAEYVARLWSVLNRFVRVILLLQDIVASSLLAMKVVFV